VHGDYSPKNMLISGPRLVILDCEVAWFGDPAFDVAFLLNHFMLKALYLSARRDAFFALAQTAWTTYARELGDARSAEVGRTAPRLLLMLMLARVDGKSPVEYLRDDASKKAAIRQFATRHLAAPPATLPEFFTAWKERL